MILQDGGRGDEGFSTIQAMTIAAESETESPPILARFRQLYGECWAWQDSLGRNDALQVMASGGRTREESTAFAARIWSGFIQAAQLDSRRIRLSPMCNAYRTCPAKGIERAAYNSAPSPDDLEAA